MSNQNNTPPTSHTHFLRTRKGKQSSVLAVLSFSSSRRSQRRVETHLVADSEGSCDDASSTEDQSLPSPPVLEVSQSDEDVAVQMDLPVMDLPLDPPPSPQRSISSPPAGGSPKIARAPGEAGEYECFVVGCVYKCKKSGFNKHLSAHSLGKIDGSLPDEDVMKSNNVVVCSHCKCVFSISGLANHTRSCNVARNMKMDRDLFDAESDNDFVLPSIEEILSCKQKSVRNIPVKCRVAFARVFSQVLKAIEITNSVDAWKELFMLCKCVLPAESRAGKKQAKRVDFVELCEAWESGKKKILWERAMRANKRGGAKHENTDAARIQLAIRKARDGEYSRACGALVSSGIAPNTIETAQKLKSKHIVADVPACPPMLCCVCLLNLIWTKFCFPLLGVPRVAPLSCACSTSLMFWTCPLSTQCDQRSVAS